MSSQAVAASDQRSDVVELGAIGAVVYLLCLVSGVSGLIYEVLWMRKLSLVFGVTTYAVTTVLTSFLAGLALGAYVFGRAIQRSHDVKAISRAPAHIPKQLLHFSQTHHMQGVARFGNRVRYTAEVIPIQKRLSLLGQRAIAAQQSRCEHGNGERDADSQRRAIAMSR